MDFHVWNHGSMECVALLYCIQRVEARHFISGFAFEALKELHDINLAHLHTRLENICFDPDLRRAMLIDLDRSQYKDRTVSQGNFRTSSPMYKYVDNNSNLKMY